MLHVAVAVALVAAGAAGRAAAPLAPIAPATVHPRVLPLEGGRNFRDLGGYRTTDGRTVRWGLLYRSGSMAGLTARDYAYLGRLGIVAVCDFRTAGERRAEPTRWQGTPAPDYWTSDAAGGMGSLAALFRPGARPTGPTMRAAMIAGYRELPEAQAANYREMFRRLVAGQAPLAFNCSAGKDRTGLAAALLLTALGVPRATVRADFALTDQVLDADRMIAGAAQTGLGPLATLPRDAAAALMRADPAYLDAAFAAIGRRYGSIDRYLAERLGVGPAERAALRRLYLQ